MPQKLGVYDVYGTLGKGKFSRIRFAVNRQTNFSYAIKILDKLKLQDHDKLENVKSEIAIMKILDNKYCVRIRDMFASQKQIFLVLDLMMGGSLMQRLKRTGRMEEEVARFYFQQLFMGVEYCHYMGIMHCGLSLDSILLDGEGTVKIADFGCATLDYDSLESVVSSKLPDIPQSSSEDRKEGSHVYLAPEILDDTCVDGRMSDIWSLGIIIYTLVAGYFPFNDHLPLADLIDEIIHMRLKPVPASFSASLRDLVTNIFVLSPADRMPIEELRDHSWMMWGIENSTRNVDAEAASDIDTESRSSYKGGESGDGGINFCDATSENGVFSFFCGILDPLGGTKKKHTARGMAAGTGRGPAGGGGNADSAGDEEAYGYEGEEISFAQTDDSTPFSHPSKSP